MFSRALGARQPGRRNRPYGLRHADPVVAFLLIGLMGAAISGVTFVASRSPHWPAVGVTDCSMPAYKTERPSSPTISSFDRRRHPLRVPMRRLTRSHWNTEADRESGAPQCLPGRLRRSHRKGVGTGSERWAMLQLSPNKALLHVPEPCARPNGVNAASGGKCRNGGRAAGPHGRPLCN